MVNLQGLEVPPIKNMAGIIPVVKNRNMLNSPYGIDALTLVGDGGLLAIQKAIYSAAVAGCETIWIVGREDSMRFIRDRVGEYIIDPKSLFINNRYAKNKTNLQRMTEALKNTTKIPIFYIQVPSRVIDIRDSEAWMGIYGAYTSLKNSFLFSNWLIPTRFFIISPYTIVSDFELKNVRKLMRKRYFKYLFAHNNKTIYDGLNLPIAIEFSELKKIMAHSKSIYTNVCLNNKDHEEISKIMMNMSFAEYYKPFLKDEAEIINLKDYYRIEDWQSYCNYISSDLCKETKIHYCVKASGVFEVYNRSNKRYSLETLKVLDLTAKKDSGNMSLQSSDITGE